MPLRQVLERVGPWPRRAVALVCLLLAAVTAIEDSSSHARSASGGMSVVVAARALPAGHTIAARDLQVLRVTPAITGTSRSPAPLIGRLLAGPLARGEPVTRTRLVTPQLVDGLPPGTVAMPVVVGDDVRGFIAPGVRIDVMSAPSDESSQRPSARPVASGVLVLAVLPNSSDPVAGGGSRLLLAVTRDDALVIASARGRQAIVVVASSP